MQVASTVRPHTKPRDISVRHVAVSVEVRLPNCGDEEAMRRERFLPPLEGLRDFVHIYE